MKRILREEKGYTLFMAVLVAILFVVLATSLLTVTMSGLAKNTTREEITQATELADKGIQHLVNQINQELQTKLGENGLKRKNFQSELEGTLNKYKCDNELVSVEGKTGSYEVCIRTYENTKDETGKENPLRKLVTFESDGIVMDRREEMVANIEIGVMSAPDSLNYALSASISCVEDKNCIPGEGNVFLHGGSTIVGDMKVDGNLIVTDRGIITYNDGSQVWLESLYPSVLPAEGAKSARLVLGGKMYTFSHNPVYREHITSDSFSNKYEKHEQPEALFETDASPQLVVREPMREKIEITEQKEHFYDDKNAPGMSNKEYPLTGIYKARSNGKIVSLPAGKIEDETDGKVFPYYLECPSTKPNCEEIEKIRRYSGYYEMSGDNTFDQFVTDGHLVISSGKVSFKNGLYVHGNLIIGDREARSTSQKVEIDGPIYVNGQVEFNGVDAKINSLMYVNRGASIRYSKINGLEKAGEEGSLIIFANDRIHFANNSLYEDTPSRIRGFFYSEDEFELYGNGSNVRIEGGVSARRIMLNGIRGIASTSEFAGSQKVSNGAGGYSYYEGRKGQNDKPSRIQIIYNPDIIETYSDLKKDEPRIYNIDPPRLLDRKSSSISL